MRVSDGRKWSSLCWNQRGSGGGPDEGGGARRPCWCLNLAALEQEKRIERLRRMPDLARFVPHQRENFQKLDFFLCRKMRTLLIAERRAAVNVNFAVTKLLALTPQHQTADKHRLEGKNLNTGTWNLNNKRNGFNFDKLNATYFQMTSVFCLLKPRAG